MEGDDLGAPESWEVADLDESMRRLMLSSSKKDARSSLEPVDYSASSTSSVSGSVSDKIPEDLLNQVDPFLREAIHNPRERLSVLRMEQDVVKFIRDPTRQQLEFQALPTSYLRLAAHRVAQHYSLQSMVLSDNSLPDGSGSKIIVRKTSEIRLPVIRLADIPVNLPSEDNSIVKVAIKQRPQKQMEAFSNASSQSLKTNSSKSVEERKEEYNRARARIFNSSNSSGVAAGKSQCDPRLQDSSQRGSIGLPKVEEKSISGASDVSSSRDSVDCSTRSSRSEKEPLSRNKPNNRVAIFRDREVERKDPDYDRSYDRYVQRFDPGFGFNGGPYAIQPMYTPALNYNTEFPQLGSTHRPQISAECQPRPLPRTIPGAWASSAPAGIGYGPRDTIMTPYQNHVGAHSTSALYAYSQFPCQRPAVPFIHHNEHVQQTLAQSYQQQADATFRLARPR